MLMLGRMALLANVKELRLYYTEEIRDAIAA